MKRLLLVMMLFLMTSFIFAQEEQQKEDKQQEISEVERIVDKYGEKAFQSFSELMETAAPAVKDGFEMVVRLQIAKGIGKLLPIIVLIILLVTIKYPIRKSEWKDNGDAKNSWAIIQILMWFLMALSIIFSVLFTYESILHLIAPEWYAVMEIVELFK